MIALTYLHHLPRGNLCGHPSSVLTRRPRRSDLVDQVHVGSSRTKLDAFTLPCIVVGIERFRPREESFG